MAGSGTAVAVVTGDGGPHSEYHRAAPILVAARELISLAVPEVAECSASESLPRSPPQVAPSHLGVAALLRALIVAWGGAADSATLKPGTIAVANGTTMSYCLTVLAGCTGHLASMYGNHRNLEGVAVIVSEPDCRPLPLVAIPERDYRAHCCQSRRYRFDHGCARSAPSQQIAT